MKAKGTPYLPTQVLAIFVFLIFSSLKSEAFSPPPVLTIKLACQLNFTNLTVGASYQLQQIQGWYWVNQDNGFMATNALDTLIEYGPPDGYRLAQVPVPVQAFASALLTNGSIAGATITAPGTGYVTAPAVSIYGDVGTNATATAEVDNGSVTNIIITDPGVGYTNIVDVEIDPPPAVASYPSVLNGVRLDFLNLTAGAAYNIQLLPQIGGTWTNLAGGSFTATNSTQYQLLIPVTGAEGFYRLLIY